VLGPMSGVCLYMWISKISIQWGRNRDVSRKLNTHEFWFPHDQIRHAVAQICGTRVLARLRKSLVCYTPQ
jgi:hypothetical protein